MNRQEAIKVVRDNWPEGRVLLKLALETLIPELKESEDLKIKRDIQYAVRCAYGDNSNNTNSILAWLEKQGEKIDAIENFDTEFEKQVSHLIASAINKEHEYNEGFVKWAANALLNYAKHELKKQDEHTYEGTFVNVDDVRDDFMSEVYRILDADTTNNRANQIIQAFDSLPTVAIKKQGEEGVVTDILIKAGLKPYKDNNKWCILVGDNIQDGICGFGDTIDEALFEFLKELVENKGEQKPADKIEPKFKVGDWIVSNNGKPRVFRIEKQGWPESIISSSLGNHIISTFTLDKQYHLWTIQDAKDGDVLYECNEKKPFIFKELKTKHIGDIASYCDIFNGIFNPNKDIWTTLDIVPATKEQRDLLFQKMKEAGYEWNAEKKELKKIEQKSDENIEPKFKIGDTIVEKDLDECGCGTIVNIKDGKYIFDDGCFIWIKQQERWQLVEKKSTWNEKIKGLNELETYILSLVPDRPLDAIKVDAKSIRYIINKEQNPAWSEEDEEMIKGLNNCLDELEEKNEWHYIYLNNKDIELDKVRNWLKSIKERIRE